MIKNIWSDKLFSEITQEELQLFNSLVLKDIKNEVSQEEIDVLMNNLELWMFQLRVIRKDVEFQLASQKSKDKLKKFNYNNDEETETFEQYTIKQNKWRMGAVRFLTAIECKMLYVKMLLSEKKRFLTNSN